MVKRDHFERHFCAVPRLTCIWCVRKMRCSHDGQRLFDNASVFRSHKLNKSWSILSPSESYRWRKNQLRIARPKNEKLILVSIFRLAVFACNKYDGGNWSRVYVDGMQKESPLVPIVYRCVARASSLAATTQSSTHTISWFTRHNIFVGPRVTWWLWCIPQHTLCVKIAVNYFHVWQV